jgi:hypothetical protein
MLTGTDWRKTRASTAVGRVAAMKTVVLFQILSRLLLLASPAIAQSASQVLGRLDAAAPTFRTATAGVTWIDHQAAINTEDKQVGTMIVKRYSRTRLQYILHITYPDLYGLALRDNTVERYMPKTNLIEERDIRRYRDLAQKLLLLGFGMTGRELADAFAISGVNSESVESHRAAHLELIPKSPDLLKQVNRIELWILMNSAAHYSRNFTFLGATTSW